MRPGPRSSQFFRRFPDHVHPATAALVGRMTTQPTADRRAAINSVITGLISAGIWRKLLVLQVYAAADSQAASRNWVGNYANATLQGSPTFSADRWVLGNDNSGYIKTGANPTTLACQQNSVTMGWYVSSPYTPTTGGQCGCWENGGTQTHAFKISIDQLSAPETGTITCNVNRTTTTSMQADVPSGGAHGLIALTRSSSTDVAINFRGTDLLTSSSFTSTGVPNSEIYVSAANSATAGAVNGGGSNRNGAFFLTSQALTAAELAIFSNLLDTYMRAVGNWLSPVVAWGDSRSVTGTWMGGLYKQDVTAGRIVRRMTMQGVSGDNSTTILARMQPDALYRDRIQVIWGLRNDISNPGQSIANAAAMTDFQTMVSLAQARSGKYVVVGATKANINNGTLGGAYTNSEAPGTTIGNIVDGWNTTLSNSYGSNYLDLQAALISWANDASAATISNGTTPTANDISDAAAGLVPRSLLATSDPIHQSTAGKYAIGYYIAEKIAALGYN